MQISCRFAMTPPPKLDTHVYSMCLHHKSLNSSSVALCVEEGTIERELFEPLPVVLLFFLLLLFVW